MSDRFLGHQLIQLGFANALRPLPAGPTVLPAFFSGWLTSELAGHLAGAAALDTAQHVARHGVRTRRDALGIAAAGANLAAYAALLTAGRRAGAEIEDALVEALGAGYREVIAREPLPDDMSAAWRSLALPFWMTDVAVTADRHVPYAPGGRRYTMTSTTTPTGRWPPGCYCRSTAVAG